MSLSIAKWEVPFQIVVPVDTLDINIDVPLASGSTGNFYLNPQACSAVIPVRVTDDDVPQGDGQITHERFYAAYELTLAVQLWANGVAACDEDAQEMADMLMRVVRGIPSQVNDIASEPRIYWTPDGSPQRMLRRIILNEALTWDLTDSGIIEATFQVKSMYPYAWDAAEITTALPATLTNTGTAAMWPVIKVYASAAFTITNTAVLDDEGNPLQIVYVGAANPGGAPITGGDYVEIDTFRNTMFLNGTGADMTPGLSVLVSDFFPIAVGANTISISGASADVLWQDAWG